MFLTLLFARLAVLCYLARFPLEAAKQTLLSKIAWTAGAALLTVHVVIALFLVHDGSHAAAVTATAERTRAAFGVDAGYGVWFNYACVAIWSADVLRLWLGGSGAFARRDAWFSFVQAYLGFMVFFGAVVFGSIWWLLPIGASVAATYAIAWRLEAVGDDHPRKRKQIASDQEQLDVPTRREEA